ncbi:MAG: hypothetical protein JSS02_28380 [Planctomycetes bacterium]|nr:hypothetical protein [Planctomycetota bacterium]
MTMRSLAATVPSSPSAEAGMIVGAAKTALPATAAVDISMVRREYTLLTGA